MMSHLNAPRQARSRDTLARIVRASKRLLRERPFAEISVGEIARRARSSVGAFYARFPDKGSLLLHLGELHGQETHAAARKLARQTRWGAADLGEIVEATVRFIVSSVRESAGLIRALALEERGEASRSSGREGYRAASQVFEELLLTRRDAIRHREPERAVAFGLSLVLSLVLRVVLFPGTATEFDLDADDDLTLELKRAFLAYLESGEQAGARSSS